MSGMFADLESAPENSVILLHAVGHNPTGLDPSREDWCEIARICQEKNLFPLLDMAYQGLTTRDVDNDAWTVRLFDRCKGLEFMVTASFCKNFTMYSERTGAILTVVNDKYVYS